MKTLQVRLLDLDSSVMGTGMIDADPLAANGHVARYYDEFQGADPARALTDIQGILEVMPSSGHLAATALHSSSSNLASLPVVPTQ